MLVISSCVCVRVCVCVCVCAFEQTAGDALSKVLTGEYNPAGRLPNTWPASLDQVYTHLALGRGES